MPAPERNSNAVRIPAEDVFAPVKGELHRVRRRILELTISKIQPIDHCFSDLMGRPGKMIRSGLLLLTARAVGGRISRKHIEYAAMVELIHTATLLHDDVIDEAAMRRGLASTNALWGNTAAVLMGDYLLSRAFSAGARLHEPAAHRMLTETARRICQGELMQNLQRGNWDLSESDYLDIVDGKTAALFACSASLGAHLAGAAGAAVRRGRQFGLMLGRAFQITDDLMDLLSSETDLGKTPGADLAHGKPTLPVIHWLRTLKGQKRNRAIERLKEGPGQLCILEELEAAGSLDYTRRVLSGCGKKAAASLAGLPESRAKSALFRLNSLMIERI